MTSESSISFEGVYTALWNVAYVHVLWPSVSSHKLKCRQYCLEHEVWKCMD